MVQIVAGAGVGSGVTVWGVLRFILHGLQKDIEYTRGKLDRHLENHPS